MEPTALSTPATSCCQSKQPPVAPGATEAEAAEATPSKLAPFVQRREDGLHLQLHVDGMHCARCIWAIESTLNKQPQVVEARVNLSTERLSLHWQGTPEQADELAQLVDDLGYPTTPLSDRPKAQQEQEQRYLLRCMAIAGFAMGNIMLISVALWSSDAELMGFATRDLLHLLSAVIAIPTIAYAGVPFFRSAAAVLKHKRTNMDVPISLALLLATGMNLFETFRSGEHVYFDSAVMLLFFLLIGRWLDAKARGKARQHATELLELLQGTATLLDGTRPRSVSIAELKPGDIIRIASGEKIPTDAKILEGNSEIDTSLVTGESLPRVTKAGDTVFGGTLNLGNALTCEVLQASEQSLLAEAIRLMEQAEHGRAHYVGLAEKAAQLYTPVVHSLAAAAFLGWLLLGGLGWQESLLIAITTLIITCPCALGLAVPVVQVLALEWLMKRGILVKSGDALERLTTIDTLVLDKTGTLTYGQPQLKEPESLVPEHLHLAASLADHSKHPLSRALSAAYTGERLAVTQVEEISGQGMKARYEGDEIFLGRPSSSAPESGTDTQIALTRNQEVLAHFTFTDQLRPEAAHTLEAFHAAGIDSLLLSGDRQAITQQMARQLGIHHATGDLHPQEKLQKLQSLQQAGHTVFMIGDGLNDAPSLAQAEVSMSPASGMDITQNTADMIFQGESLYAAYESWSAARAATRLIKQNFALAIGYNCLAIPIALAGMVTPLIAAIAMSASSLIVIANSFRLRRHKTN